MRSRILASLSFLLVWSGARAQTADDFFHGGAQHYLTNNVPAALESVTNGLALHPDDEKLKKLYELLKQQQQQNQQNQKDQKQDQQNEQQKQDEKKDQKSQQQPGKDEQQKKDEQKKQEEAQDQKAKEKKEQQSPKAGAKSKDKPDEKKEAGDSQPVAAHAMTPQEAKQLLDAQKGDEQVLIFQPKAEPKSTSKPLKDW